LDLTRARLTIGDAEFTVIDVNQTLTAWLSTNDRSLAETPVIKRQGLYNESEDSYVTSYWVLEDYRVSSKSGGAYEFILMNAFKAMSNGVYSEFDGESYRLLIELNPSDAQLQIEPPEEDAVFRDQGFLIVVDTVTGEQELIYYGSTSGSVFRSLQRNHFGVGASNPSGKVFDTENTSVYHVWVKRGGPIDVLMEWLTTSDAVPETGAAEQLADGGLENWSSGQLVSWSEVGTITEETTIVHTSGGSSAKFSAGAAQAGILQTRPSFDGNDVGYGFTVWVYVEDNGNALETVRVRIRNTATNKIWSTDPGVPLSERWQTNTGQYTLEYEVTLFGSWFPVFIGLDNPRSDGDTFQFELYLAQQTGAVAYFDDLSMYGPITGIPNGYFDQMDGDGVNLGQDLINFQEVFRVINTYWPTPTFDGTTGNKLTGTAVLFVEQDPIDDLKKWMEEHILLPFGLKPLVDSRERLTLSRYYEIFPAETTIGDKWRKAEFSASKWQRNFSKAVNNAILLTDYDLDRGKHVHSLTQDHDVSIASYGKSKALRLESRGGRTGRLSFPQYDSMVDLEIAWSRIALEVSDPWTQLEIKAFYEFRDLSQVDAVILNVPGIPDLENGVRGLVGQRFFVDSKKIDEKKGYILLTVRLRRDAFRPSFIAPTGHPQYGLATDDEKVYCFIAEGPPSDPFGDGGEAYRIT
jgi:hypothetical protein